jgi:putative peptidoglycan lipid II flippase
MTDASNQKLRANAERGRIAGQASIVAAGTLLSRLLGLVREQVLAAFFTRGETDAFFVAFLIPNVLRQVLAEGAVQTGVLPVLAQVREQQGEARAQAAFQSLRGVSLALLTCVTLLGVWFAPELTQLFAGGYRAYGDQFERTVTLTRWVFPYIFFMGSAALGVAALNTHGRFVVTSYAPGLLNVAFVVCAFGLRGWFVQLGFDPLLALAAGVLLGGVLQAVAQLPSLRAIGYLARPRLDLRDPAVLAVMRRMGPVLVGFGIYYLDVVVARHLLSDMGVGPQSYFTFALRLCDFPQGIFVMAIQSATLPALAAFAARGEFEELKQTFGHGLRLALFVALPATALVVVLAHPLVTLVFERGNFDALTSLETSRALVAQGAGIWTVAIVRQLVVVFYALGDTRSPVWVSGIDFLVFLGAALLLRGPLGHAGISWAITISSISQVLMLWLQLKRRYPIRLALGELLTGTGKLLLATALAVAATAMCRYACAALGPASLGNAATAVVGSLVFVSVYLASCAQLKSPELRSVIDPIRRRLKPRV